VLQAREQLLQDLFSEARIKIADLSSDEGRYVQLLEGIVVEVRYHFCRVSDQSSRELLVKAMLRILEPEVTVFVRKEDEILAKAAVDNAARKYTDISGRDVRTTVAASLSNDSYGSTLSTFIGEGSLSIPVQCWRRKAN
jgi:V-type H+-transporting ATPase subunit E